MYVVCVLLTAVDLTRVLCMCCRQLCLLLRSEHIYQCCSEILQTEEDLKFAAHMIQTLSTILLTSTELFELRTQLKDLKTEVRATYPCAYGHRTNTHRSYASVCLMPEISGSFDICQPPPSVHLQPVLDITQLTDRMISIRNICRVQCPCFHTGFPLILYSIVNAILLLLRASVGLESQK